MYVSRPNLWTVPLKWQIQRQLVLYSPFHSLCQKDIHQEWTPVEDVGRFLLTVRAEYLFLIILHHSYMDDHSRVQMEYEDFCRYGYRDIFCRNSFNSSLCFFA